MRKVVLVLLVICCFGGWALAEEAGFSNLIYGVVQGTKDLKAVYSQPVRVDYKKAPWLSLALLPQVSLTSRSLLLRHL